MDIDESDIGSIKGYIIGYNDNDEERKPLSDDDINDLI
jgi:hypothetical protein